MSPHVAQRNGRTATAEELAPLAFAGFAHFTAMQVRDGRVRGLDLHLDRLRAASLELFGDALPDDRIRSYVREALKAGPSDVSLTVTIHLPGDLEVLVRTRPPSSGPAGPLALTAVEHERVLPAVKHTGEMAKTYYRRQAVGEGFDDAAFVDRRGRLSEATIWNLAFWDGDTVVWPDADLLTGTMMGIVQRRLGELGVPQRVQEVTLTDLPGLAGAVVMNSWTPGIAVRRIGATPLPSAPAFVSALHRAYETEPLTRP
ncbi:Branched-chain amino acid aminotransferase/4-amino-4-deoxychorismate lyase [Amycolatopsis lurida]|uniref:Branched-chain amino acid aminotransferase n=1 Tax=Amycolatopsis lurida NRRL 2430 TaxID=1460371 RepID=A0A2P2FWT6_AMYLU|nr:aminotransferase class IV family protein [Amycolatopsis lurida]KFU81198.1 branched-chain amino acid aminotransferase [Amycolatopsis lurida NRRL 2430]SEE18155.1 Branched-chain amino acid aminotransferase/4-amino-4-deoxychorismate lyase [Amycolatopsis lurida]